MISTSTSFEHHPVLGTNKKRNARSAGFLIAIAPSESLPMKRKPALKKEISGCYHLKNTCPVPKMPQFLNGMMVHVSSSLCICNENV